MLYSYYNYPKHKVNKVNNRKEFFNVSLEDIKKELLDTIKNESYINDSDKSEESEEVTRKNIIVEKITSKGVFKK